MSFYGVTSVLRDITLSILVVIIFISLQFIISFLYQWLKAPYRRFSDLKFTWTLFLSSIILSIFFLILADFYTIGAESNLYLKFSTSALLVRLAIFANIQESALPFKTKNIFGIVGVSAAALTLFGLIDQYMLYLYLVVGILYSLLFVMFTIQIVKQSIRPFRKYSFTFLLGFILGIAGYISISDYTINVFGMVSYTIGALLILVSVMITSLSINKFPSFSELNWKEKLRDIYLIHKSGLPLFHIAQDNGESVDDTSDILRGGALSSINVVLKNITKSEMRIRAIDQGNIKLLFGHRDPFILVVIAEADLQILHYKISQFFAEFFSLYKNIPEEYYNPKAFQPARTIAVKIFLEES